MLKKSIWVRLTRNLFLLCFVSDSIVSVPSARAAMSVSANLEANKARNQWAGIQQRQWKTTLYVIRIESRDSRELRQGSSWTRFFDTAASLLSHLRFTDHHIKVMKWRSAKWRMVWCWTVSRNPSFNFILAKTLWISTFYPDLLQEISIFIPSHPVSSLPTHTPRM